METTLLPVLVLKDFSVTIEGVAYNGKKGEIVELPAWVGKALEEVRFLGVKGTDMKRFLMEEGSQALSKIPQNFYDSACMTQEKDREWRKIFMQLLNKRVEKIAQAASYGTMGRDLCHEEKVLYSRLASVIEEWKSRIIKDVLGEHDEV